MRSEGKVFSGGVLERVVERKEGASSSFLVNRAWFGAMQFYGEILL